MFIEEAIHSYSYYVSYKDGDSTSLSIAKMYFDSFKRWLEKAKKFDEPVHAERDFYYAETFDNEGKMFTRSFPYEWYEEAEIDAKRTINDYKYATEYKVVKIHIAF